MVDAPLDYNLLEGPNWIYNMKVIMSSVFRVVCFPFEGRIVTVLQKYFDNSGTKNSSRDIIPFIDNT